jgi:hypothetical protein
VPSARGEVMAGALKTVYVELVPKTKKLTSGLQKVDRQVKKSTLKMKVMAAAIGTSLVLAARKAARAFDQFAGQADDLAKLARGLRVTTNELQELQFVLERTGGSGSSVRNMVLALEKALGDAAGGSLEYVEAWQDLGLNFKEIEKLGVAERFWEIRRAVKASNGAVKASAAAQIILARGMKANVSTMQETEESILAVRKEFEKLGGVTKEASTLAEVIRDLDTNSKTLGDNIKSIAFEKIAPGVIEARKAFEDYIVELKESGMLDGRVTIALAAVAAGFVAMGVAAAVAAVMAFPVIGVVLAIGAAVAAVAAAFTALSQWDGLDKLFGITSGGSMGSAPAFSPYAPGHSKAAPVATVINQHITATGLTTDEVLASMRRRGEADSRKANR